MRSYRQPDGTLKRRTREDKELPDTAAQAIQWVDQAIQCLEGDRALKGRSASLVLLFIYTYWGVGLIRT